MRFKTSFAGAAQTCALVALFGLASASHAQLADKLEQGQEKKQATHGSHGGWSYEGETGPEHWAALEGDNLMCSSGRNQSPINIDKAFSAKLPPIEFHYARSGKEAEVHNGHTVQINFEPGSYIVMDGSRYDLVQVHFHHPSENEIRGKRFPLEGHFVHKDRQGNLAVVAVMFKEGRENKGLNVAWDHMPAGAGQSSTLEAHFRPESILPKSKSYYRFSGSLTTPPCSEGVLWMVMKQPVEISRSQLEKLRHALPHENNRPVQPLNARQVNEG
ncbi:carbonic anhydrase family protein [Variovorax paradoxus]|nr:carbonic anhydrase family protein [Variovorax paradoxus]